MATPWLPLRPPRPRALSIPTSRRQEHAVSPAQAADRGSHRSPFLLVVLGPEAEVRAPGLSLERPVLWVRRWRLLALAGRELGSLPLLVRTLIPGPGGSTLMTSSSPSHPQTASHGVGEAAAQAFEEEDLIQVKMRLQELQGQP